MFLSIHDELVVYTMSERQVVDNKGQIIGLYIAVKDITQYNKMVTMLEQEADIDQLTGIANRRSYEQQYMEMDKEENLPLSVIIADVNGLKKVNDQLGHNFGDELLCSVVTAILRACPENAFFARIGGDEFAIIIPRCANVTVNSLIEEMKESLKHEKTELFIPSVAFGAATKTHIEQNMQNLISEADKKMYQQKEYDRRK